ncbi:DHS-like NAD/FAD-binding domain-containing protein [Lactifluus volemus]|nr:DHS-like NAD/FAD-binding domain-containing protein [Lactifluus volemus]
MSSLPSKDMTAFKELLSSSKHIIAVAGAGLSAASGIPTFRGAGASYGAFKSNPSRVWQFYHYRREKALAASPNAAHIALAKFSVESIRKQSTAPDATFTLITQNVDGLSARALEQVQQRDAQLASESSSSAEPQLLEMHGRSCGHCELITRSPICAALSGTEELVESGITEPVVDVADLPRCTKCGALARPGVVWFGEEPQHLPTIDELVIGPICVYPAASYGRAVQRHGGKVAVFNLERSDRDDDADFLFLGPCEETIPEALGL